MIINITLIIIRKINSIELCECVMSNTSRSFNDQWMRERLARFSSLLFYLIHDATVYPSEKSKLNR